MSYSIEGARCVSATEKAILVEGIDAKPVWIPQSQIDDDSEVYQVGDEGKLVVSDWWAEKQGWI